MSKVKVGDLVLIVGNRWVKDVALHVFRVNDILLTLNKEILVVIRFNGDNIQLRPDHFEVIEWQDTIAQVGDTIIVTDPSIEDSFGGRYTVIESDVCPIGVSDISECVWCMDKGNTYQMWLKHRSYEVLKRIGNSSAVCPDCKGTGKIELFTSTVACKCLARQSIVTRWIDVPGGEIS